MNKECQKTLHLSSKEGIFNEDLGEYEFNISNAVRGFKTMQISLASIEMPLCQNTVEESNNHIYFHEGIKFTNLNNSMKLQETISVFPNENSIPTSNISIGLPSETNKITSIVSNSGTLTFTTENPHNLFTFNSGDNSIISTYSKYTEHPFYILHNIAQVGSISLTTNAPTYVSPTSFSISSTAPKNTLGFTTSIPTITTTTNSFLVCKPIVSYSALCDIIQTKLNYEVNDRNYIVKYDNLTTKVIITGGHGIKETIQSKELKLTHSDTGIRSKLGFGDMNSSSRVSRINVSYILEHPVLTGGEISKNELNDIIIPVGNYRTILESTSYDLGYTFFNKLNALYINPPRTSTDSDQDVLVISDANGRMYNIFLLAGRYTASSLAKYIELRLNAQEIDSILVTTPNVHFSTIYDTTTKKFIFSATHDGGNQPYIFGLEFDRCASMAQRLNFNPIRLRGFNYYESDVVTFYDNPKSTYRLSKHLNSKKVIIQSEKIDNIIATAESVNTWTTMGNISNSSGSNNDNFGYSVDCSDDGLIFASGAPNHNSGAGFVKVYRYVSSSWEQVGGDLVGNATNNDQFGTSVALSGDGKIMAVGAIGDSTQNGYVKIFEFKDGSWAQIGQTLSGQAAGDDFGKSIDLSYDGKIVIIGADETGVGAGTVKIFKYTSNNWVQRGSDITGDSTSNAFLGQSVAISSLGNIVVIGAPGYVINLGGVRIYEYIDNNWISRGSILGNSSSDRFGHSVDISADGSTISVGASTGNYLKVYRWNGSSYTQLGSQINLSNINTHTISRDGNVVALVSSNVFVSYEYKGSSSGWVLVGSSTNLSILNSVALSADGKTAITGLIGTPYFNKGSVYAYRTNYFECYIEEAPSTQHSFVHGLKDGDVIEVSRLHGGNSTNATSFQTFNMNYNADNGQRPGAVRCIVDSPEPVNGTINYYRFTIKGNLESLQLSTNDRISINLCPEAYPSFHFGLSKSLNPKLIGFEKRSYEYGTTDGSVSLFKGSSLTRTPYIGPFQMNLNHVEVAYILLNESNARAMVDINQQIVLHNQTKPCFAKLVFYPDLRLDRTLPQLIRLPSSETIQTIKLRFVNDDLSIYETHNNPFSLSLNLFCMQT